MTLNPYQHMTVQCTPPLRFHSSVVRRTYAEEPSSRFSMPQYDVDEGRIQSWKCRDRFVQFFDHYFRADRVQESWAWGIIQKRLTEFLYPRLGDVDIRVRFRAATVVPHLFTIEGFAHRNPLELYAEMRQDLTSDLNEYDVISWFFFLILTLWIDMRRC